MDKSKLFSHTSPAYTGELIALHDQLLEMSKIVISQVQDAFTSITTSNMFLAQEVMKNDEKVNDYEKKIDQHTISIIARRQPTANDLRLLIASLKLTQDLERIGDEAKRFASQSAMIINENQIENTNLLQHLTELTLRKLNKSLDALKDIDVISAMVQLRQDAQTLIEMRRIQSEICKQIESNPSLALYYLRLNNCTRACERIGDRSSNICEFIIFLIQGLDIRHIDSNKTN